MKITLTAIDLNSDKSPKKSTITKRNKRPHELNGVRSQAFCKESGLAKSEFNK